MTSAKGIGIPIKLMHESEGHVITVSLSQLQVLLGKHRNSLMHSSTFRWNYVSSNMREKSP